MKHLFISLSALIVLSNSFYSDNGFESENSVPAKNRQVKNVCLIKGSTSDAGAVKKVYAQKGSIKKKVCSAKGGSSGGGKNGNA